MDEFAVIGSGIGGCSSALMLSQKFQTTLYEKEPYLGGCASTFRHKGYFYNSGATTFAGYTKGTYMYDFFEKHHVDFQKKHLQSALTVLIDGKSIERFQDEKAFLNEINTAFYHRKNSDFYELIIDINQRFFAIHDYYYSNASLFDKLASLTSFKTLFWKFYPYLFTNAEDFIKNYFGTIDETYLNYLDNQVLIVAQAKIKEINFFTAALALSYQFMDNYYIYGGMGAIFEAMETKLPRVEKATFIQKITKKNSHFILHSNTKEFEAKNIILNASLFDTATLFDDTKIKTYLSHYAKLDSGISAFMLYLRVDTPKKLKHHYQIILDKTIPYTISNSLFVSFGDKEDTKMSQSVTISVHTKNAMWQHERAREQKIELIAIIKKIICDRLGIRDDEIKDCFGATPSTFKRFINRTTLGGIPMKKELLPYHLPANDSPIKGLYHVGDTTFAGQGWLGVMMGVRNIEKLLC